VIKFEYRPISTRPFIQRRHRLAEPLLAWWLAAGWLEETLTGQTG
jgi:hypothetical protein